MNEYSGWGRAGWLENVNQSEYNRYNTVMWNIIYYLIIIIYFFLICYQSHLTKHCTRKDKNEIMSCKIGICAIWRENCLGNIIETFPVRDSGCLSSRRWRRWRRWTTRLSRLMDCWLLGKSSSSLPWTCETCKYLASPGHPCSRRTWWCSWRPQPRLLCRKSLKWGSLAALFTSVAVWSLIELTWTVSDTERPHISD